MKMICDHRAKVKRTKDDWHDGYYDGLTAALMMLSEDEPADTDKPIWEAKDKMTLEELAHELRKIFRFKYLTVFKYPGWEYAYIALYGVKPSFLHHGGLNEWAFMGNSGGDVGFFESRLSVSLDLSEYADENGVIDYSKCIVEVE